MLLSKQKFMTSDQQSMLFIYYSQVRAKCVFLLHVSTCTTTIYINIFCILQNTLIFAYHVLCDSDSVSEYSHRIFCRTLRVYCRATSDPWGIKQKTDLRIRPSLLVYCSPEWARHVWDNIKVYLVNDNNPPGLSISTWSLWTAERRGCWSAEDCGFCSSE